LRFFFPILSFYDDSSEVIMAGCLLRLAVMNETYWSFEVSADKLRAFITCRHWEGITHAISAQIFEEQSSPFFYSAGLMYEAYKGCLNAPFSSQFVSC
jgi:hypothetical protein